MQRYLIVKMCRRIEVSFPVVLSHRCAVNVACACRAESKSTEMLTDDASVESSVMDLGMTTTGSTLEGREGLVGSVSSVRVVATPTSEKRISSAPAGDEGSLNDFDDEEDNEEFLVK